MNHRQLNAYIAAARPVDYASQTSRFTDAVMKKIHNPEIVSNVVRRMSVNKKETLSMKLKHLPTLAIVAITIGLVVAFAGTTYAIVQTVKQLTGVSVTQSGVNEFGRQQLQVAFDSCDTQKKKGTTYELKADSGLSAEDGARVLQARCDIDAMEAWLRQDQTLKEQLGDITTHLPIFNGVGFTTVKEVTANGQILLAKNNILTTDDDSGPTVPTGARFIDGNKEVGKDSLRVGDTVMVFSSAFYVPATRQSPYYILFKLPLETKYYDLTLQSYVKVRSACKGNPDRKCLQASNINHVSLLISYGNGMPSQNDTRDLRVVQGRVVSYYALAIKIDVGQGVIYTIETPSPVIQNYNNTTVNRLGSINQIYAKTDPEELKVKVGDSLEIYYRETPDVYSHQLTWDNITSIGLMVERTVKDMMVLRKY